MRVRDNRSLVGLRTGSNQKRSSFVSGFSLEQQNKPATYKNNPRHLFLISRGYWILDASEVKFRVHIGQNFIVIIVSVVSGRSSVQTV
jgi:hypothetical protein